MTSWTGGMGMAYISIDTFVVGLILFMIVRCFQVMSSIFEVWPKGVRWQAWGAGGRCWLCILTYQTVSTISVVILIVIMSIYVWWQLFKHPQSECTDPGNQHRQGWPPRPFWWQMVIQCKPYYLLQDLPSLIITYNGRPLWHLRYLFDTLLLLNNSTFLPCLAKWYHPCNHWQPISIWQQLWAVPMLLFHIRVGTIGDFPSFFCFWSAAHFLYVLPSGPILATIDN